MCGGGFFRDSIILVSGATGTGKTLIGHAVPGRRRGRRASAACCSPSRRAATSCSATPPRWGYDFEEMERDGLLRRSSRLPGRHGLEDHLLRMRDAIEEFKPNRVAVDSLSALERVTTLRSFREFVIGLTSFIKQQEIAGLFTSTTPSLLGGHVGHREAHLHAHGLHHPAALRGDVGRDAARPDGAQDARLAARPGHPRVHHRGGRACTWASRSATSPASCPAT